jgi:hypothetical protein
VFLVVELRFFNKSILIVFVFVICLGFNVNSTLGIIGQSEGFVQYNVSTVGFDNSILPVDFTITKTIGSTEIEGFLDLTFSLVSEKTNFTFSRNVNASSFPMVFPYLSGLTNQSFSYEIEKYSISASLVNSGRVPITFNDVMYEGNKYLMSFEAKDNSGMKIVFASGEITSMPSGLIYSIEVWFNDTMFIEIVLVSTDLKLENISNNVDPIGAAIVGGGVISAFLIAAPTIYRKVLKNNRSKKQKISEIGNLEKEKKDEEKPSYWVD